MKDSSKPQKMRIDQLLSELGLVRSREAGRGELLAGNVFVNGERVDKPGTSVPINADVKVNSREGKFVSRGGLKLARAFEQFDIDVKEKVAIDIGASTGGFTDCMLKNGASKVFCVDVGYGQLAWELRQDPRVAVMERTNARYLTPEALGGDIPQFATVDVSFISLDKILPPLYSILSHDGQCVCLIKPQFEAGRENIGKHGVVRSKEVQEDVIARTVSFARGCGFKDIGLTWSPIKGPEGNIEFLIHLAKGDVEPGRWFCDDMCAAIADVVASAHENL